MSKEINNHNSRKEAIKDILKMLHNNTPVEEVRDKFKATLGNVTTEEISQAEQALIEDGISISEIQGLCDIHAMVFDGSIEEIHSQEEHFKPGHPIHTFKQENERITALIENVLSPLLLSFEVMLENKDNIVHLLRTLEEIDYHYLKKENLFFPYLEKNQIYGPPKVMWGIDDEIRAELKEVTISIAEGENLENSFGKLKKLITKILDMVHKEKTILIPLLLDTLDMEDFITVYKEMDDIGYCLIQDVPKWNYDERYIYPTTPTSGNTINLSTGVLTLEQLEGIFSALPVDVSFVDKDRRVQYFSVNSERIFPRSKTIIGREVINCHPPTSVHVVNKILDDFESGKKDHEDFWLKIKDKFIYIRYFAVRDKDNNYLGTLEVTQNITSIQQLTGEKKLLSE